MSLWYSNILDDDEEGGSVFGGWGVAAWCELVSACVLLCGGGGVGNEE